MCPTERCTGWSLARLWGIRCRGSGRGIGSGPSLRSALRSLDPPEAYWADGATTDIAERTIRGSRREAFADRQSRSAQPYGPFASKHSGLAITSFVLALLSIPTIILIPVGSILALASLVCGIFALQAISASHGRLQGRWMAIFGCVIFAVHVVAIGCLFLMMLS